MGDFERNLPRDPGLTAIFENATPTVVSLPTAGTEVAVNNLADLQPSTGAVDFEYVKDDVNNGAHVITLAPGPVVVRIGATFSADVAAGAIQELLLQRLTVPGSPGTWVTVARDFRLEGVPTDAATKQIEYRIDSAQAKDSEVNIFGTAFRVAFVSSVNTDAANIYRLTYHFERPAANRSLAS